MKVMMIPGHINSSELSRLEEDECCHNRVVSANKHNFKPSQPSQINPYHEQILHTSLHRFGAKSSIPLPLLLPLPFSLGWV